MVHFSQSLMPDVPLATSLPTTFTFHPNNQMDEQSTLQQQQSLPSSSQSQLNSSSLNQQQRSSPNDDRTSNTNPQTHTNDYETRLRCPNCETWVVNLSDHLRKTHRIASPVDRKPLLRMARLEKRRMTESANNTSSLSSSSTATTTTTTILKAPPSSTIVSNGLPTSHTNTNEIENLLFKHEHDPNTLSNQQFSVTIPENILLNQQMTNSIAQYSSSNKRQRDLDDHLEHTSNGPLSPSKKPRIGILDGTKLSQTTHSSSNKSNKKNRNKPQQQPQTIIKTAASGIFPQQQPQQTVTMQNIDESSDDLSKVLQMMGNEMNFLNQHLQTTSILLQKQLDLARDSLHACSVQFAHLKRMIQQQI
jgi:hypothetical protein